MRRTAALALLALTATTLPAQRGGRGLRLEPNVPYTGQFTFVRLRYGAGEGLGGWGDPQRTCDGTSHDLDHR